jgi:predicted HTH domain antitoxin
MSDGQSAEDKANIFMIIGMFTTKTVSLEKAAELAGKSIWDFIEILKKYDIPWGTYTQESQNLDDITIAKLTGGLYEKD